MAERPEPVPDLDWEPSRARAFVDGVADIYEELLAKLPSLPVIVDEGAGDVRAGVAIDVPDEPMGQEELFDYLRRMTFEHSAFPGHPRFYAYVSGAGTVPGAAADLLASGINMNPGGWRLGPSATEIEMALTRWFARDMFGMREGSGGALASGGAMANLIALKVARDARAGWDVRTEGVAAGPPLGFYLSSETHVVSDRAADMLGVGAGSVRHVPVDDAFRMRVDDLRSIVRRDRDAGVRPIAVVANAGTVSTGAVDDLAAIADVCREEDLWMHVDAAYGGPAVLADDLRPLFDGIERADSIAFDPHKWLYTPLPGGCVLVRDLDLLREAFDPEDVSYIVKDEDHTDWGIDLGRHSPNFSRGFWSLRVWVSLLAHGRDAYARRISHDAALARYLGALVEERDDLELMTPVGLSITCFRYVPPGLPDREDRDAYLDELNRRLMTEIQLGGTVFCSNAILDGRFCLRSCIVNYRTEADDVEALLEIATQLGGELDDELRPEGLR
ncbi:MAG TPA: pyridoxal-dependent decarboxylase [Actinomycetota bacterium]|jgi:glutamate/tyrosine decarboxylase-like PLP-dependent enzyme|nr:pyridoxal-dependent decarboxylase [Actinomycetota bacterium]